MYIIFINKRDEIINVSRLSIKVVKSYLVGIDERGNVVEIERYKDEGKAREVLRGVSEIVSGKQLKEDGGVVIDLRGEGEGEE